MTIKIEQPMLSFGDKLYKKWFISNEYEYHEYEYLWPDGEWRSYCYHNDEDHGYFNSKEEAEAMLAKMTCKKENFAVVIRKKGVPPRINHQALKFFKRTLSACQLAK